MTMSQLFHKSLLPSHTSSSAIAQRLHDASCQSVVSFNSTIPRVQFFIISYFGFGFTSAYNSILFCCLQCNVEPCCHTQSHDSQTTVTVYSKRPHLVSLAQYTVMDYGTVTVYSTWRLVVQ